MEMYPRADVPVLQISLPTLDPARLMGIGRKLAPLRDEGVLIVGSGFFTHNLAALRHRGPGVPAWSAEFDAWGREALAASDVDALLDFERKSPAGRLAHPPYGTLRPALRHPRRGRPRPRRPPHPGGRLLAGPVQALPPVRLTAPSPSAAARPR
ncbi:hypothetical protein GCM10020254_49520 [Streptomyces goshikiensis]